MRSLLLSALLIGAAPLMAQTSAKQAAPAPGVPGAKDASRITGGTYKADPDHTLVSWQVDHLGFTPFWGLFGDIQGVLKLDKADPSKSSVSVTIPVSHVLTTSKGLNEHLLRPGTDGGKPDFFGPSPADAKFTSTSVVVEKGDKAKITGSLTLNGVTKPVILHAKFHGAGKMPKEWGGNEIVGFTASTSIKRSDFGIMGGIPLVSDRVKLKIAAAFVK